MIELSPVGRGGTPDEVGSLGALLMEPDGAFITGSDFLLDGGVTASFFYGELAPDSLTETSLRQTEAITNMWCRRADFSDLSVGNCTSLRVVIGDERPLHTCAMERRAVHDEGDDERGPNGLPRVRLREVGDSDKDFLSSLSTPQVEGEWNTFDDPPEERLNGSHYGGGARIVEVPDGTPVGIVTWIQIPHGPNRRSLAWNIGITILPSYRGRRIGASAQRAIADELFADSDANRVMADTDVENIAEQRSLARAGFTREGIARAAQWRMGAWHDRVIYSRIRSD